MGSGKNNWNILGLVLKYDGKIEATQDSKNFLPTTLTPVTVDKEDLKNITFNDTLGHENKF